MPKRGPRVFLAVLLAVACLALLPRLLHDPAIGQIRAPAQPAEDCTPLTDSNSLVCTLTLSGALSGGTALQDTITNPASSTFTACLGATGGLACGAAAGNTVSVTCGAATCATGSFVQLQIGLGGSGVLAESMNVTPGGGGLETFLYSGQSELNTPVLAESCAPAAVFGGTTTCTLEGSTAAAQNTTFTLTITGPAGATIVSCANAIGGAACGTPTSGAGNSITITCTLTVCGGGGPSTAYGVQLAITSSTTGTLAETLMVSGTTTSQAMYSGEAVFPSGSGTVAPPTGEEKWCNNTTAPVGLNQITGSTSQPIGVTGPATSFTLPLFAGASTCWIQLTEEGIPCGSPAAPAGAAGCADGYVTVALATPASSAVISCSGGPPAQAFAAGSASPGPQATSFTGLSFLPNGGPCQSQAGGTSLQLPCGSTAGTPAAVTTVSATCSSVSFDIASLLSGCLTQTVVQSCPLGSNTYRLTGQTATVTVSFQSTPANSPAAGAIVLGQNTFSFQGAGTGTLLVTATPQLIPANGTLASVVTATFACGAGVTFMNSGFPVSAYFANGIPVTTNTSQTPGTQSGRSAQTTLPILGGGSLYCGAGLPGTFTFASPGQILFDNGRPNESVGCGLNAQQNLYGGTNPFNSNNLNPTLPADFTCSGAAVLAIGGGAAGDAPVNVTYASAVGGIQAVGSTLITVAPSSTPVISLVCNPNAIAGGNTGSLCTATVTDQNGKPLTGMEGVTVTWTVSDPKEADILPCVIGVGSTIDVVSTPNVIPEITPSAPCNPASGTIPGQSVTWLNGQTTALLVASSYAHPEVLTVLASLGVLVPPEYACEVTPYTPVGYGTAAFPGSAATSAFLPGLTGCGAGNAVGFTGLASALATAGSAGLTGVVTLPNATNAATSVSVGGPVNIVVLGATPTSPLALLRGCNNVIVSTTAGTPILDVVQLVNPPSSVVAVWAYNNTAHQFKAGYFRDPNAPLDYIVTGVASGSAATTSVASGSQVTESYFICVDEAGTMSSA